MEWIDKLNDAVSYIEAHLTEKIDYAHAARVGCCSLSKFQRLFLLAAGVTPGEYARLRRMALAAADLTESDVKIVDLAAKYGYESPEAFTRAFRAFHGVSPSVARKLGLFNEYARISFDIKIRGGDFLMGTHTIIRIEEHGGERVVSFEAHGPDPERRAFDRLRAWAVENIRDFSARRCIGFAPDGHHP